MSHYSITPNYWALPGLLQGVKFLAEKRKPDYIMNVVCAHFNFPEERIRGVRRDKNLVHVRYLCIYFLRKYTGMTLVSIAKIFRRDHTSIVHALQTVKNRMECEEGFADNVLLLDQKL
jgi:chromosomal replication initiator protein